MSLAGDIKTALNSLVGNRVYPDVTPDSPVFPLIVYQQVGGKAFEFVEQVLPNKDNARMQVVVWSKTRLEADSIARSARVALVEGVLKATTFSAPVSLYDETLKLYGSRCDFGIWYAV